MPGKITQRSLLITLFVLLSGSLFSQNSLVLNSKTRKSVVTNISDLLLNNYVFPDTALKMSACILKKLKAGAYDKITDPVAFSDALTIDLYSVYRDGHMQVRYASQNSVPVPVSNPVAIPEDPLRRMKEANFGLRKVEVLTGNIGYLQIDRFWTDSIYGIGTVKSALQFVSNTSSLIIDVRDCGGGSQEAVRLICSYFFDHPVHLNDMYDRTTNRTTEYWTKPDGSLPQLTQIPLYLLTNDKTFSAAEEFCYDLQTQKRATVVGERTGGGAHGTFSQEAGYGFSISLPYCTAINPITHTNWESVGIKPEIEVASGKALGTAEILVIERMIAGCKDSAELFRLNWDLELVKAATNPVVIDSETLGKYAGIYGERALTMENGKLYYQRTGRPKFELEAMTSTIMKPLGNTYFKIEFVKNEQGETDRITVYYQDNRVEPAPRNNR
jgi:hypothetical protein